MSSRLTLAACALLALPAATAVAQKTVTSRPNSGYTEIARGVNEIGAQSLWIFDYASEDAGSTVRLSLTSGLSARRFVRTNLALGLSARGFYRSSGGPSRDYGGLVGVEAARYLALGEGVFLAPTLGVGAMVGTRRTPLEPGLATEASLLGGAVTVGLPLVLYAWDKFNVSAGLSLVLAAGTASDDGVSTSFAHLDGGFNVGVAYYF